MGIGKVKLLGWALGMALMLSSGASAQGQVTVKDFQFEGNTQVSAERLSQELEDLRGQNLRP